MLTLLYSVMVSPAHAQVDPGYFVLRQGEEEVGWVYVPDHGDPCRYVEYWFLYEDYRFLNAGDRNDLELKSQGAAPTYEEWVRRMWEAHPKGKLMTSVSTETREGCR